MKIIFLFFLALCSFNFSWSQAKIRLQLSGSVTDAKTNQPLPGATVTIEDAKLGTTTDSLGKFVFKNVPQGHHLLEVSYTGYSSILEHLDLNTDKELTLSLSSAIVEYQAVTVTGVSTSTSVRKTPVSIFISGNISMPSVELVITLIV